MYLGFCKSNLLSVPYVYILYSVQRNKNLIRHAWHKKNKKMKDNEKEKIIIARQSINKACIYILFWRKP